MASSQTGKCTLATDHNQTVQHNTDDQREAKKNRRFAHMSQSTFKLASASEAISLPDRKHTGLLSEMRIILRYPSPNDYRWEKTALPRLSTKYQPPDPGYQQLLGIEDKWKLGEKPPNLSNSNGLKQQIDKFKQILKR